MKKSYKIALGGIVSALCLLTMFLTGVIPILSILLPMVAGILMMIIVVEVSIKWAFLTYLSVSILAMIVTFDKEAVLLFIMFFGHYPIIRFKIDAIKSKITRNLLKFSVFNICVLSFFWLTTYLLGLTAFLDEINDIGKYGGLIMIGFVNFIFLLYEYNLDIFYEMYIKRLKPILKSNSF